MVIHSQWNDSIEKGRRNNLGEISRVQARKCDPQPLWRTHHFIAVIVLLLFVCVCV